MKLNSSDFHLKASYPLRFPWYTRIFMFLLLTFIGANICHVSGEYTFHPWLLFKLFFESTELKWFQGAFMPVTPQRSILQSEICYQCLVTYKVTFFSMMSKYLMVAWFIGRGKTEHILDQEELVSRPQQRAAIVPQTPQIGWKTKTWQLLAIFELSLWLRLSYVLFPLYGCASLLLLVNHVTMLDSDIAE